MLSMVILNSRILALTDGDTQPNNFTDGVRAKFNKELAAYTTLVGEIEHK